MDIDKERKELDGINRGLASFCKDGSFYLIGLALILSYVMLGAALFGYGTELLGKMLAACVVLVSISMFLIEVYKAPPSQDDE